MGIELVKFTLGKSSISENLIGGGGRRRLAADWSFGVKAIVFV
ncbi:MAG: hypothetical protein Q7J10_05745 [Methanosarcinaceae archaeon]|nr:hypothetical protein [Methanosarcinaceae archaeon]